MQEQNKPKAKSRTINIKASSTRIVLDQSHKGFGNYNSRSPYNPMNKQTRTLPHEAKRSVVNHGDKISGKGWSLAVLQLTAAPRDDDASGVAFLLCLTRMYLWMLFSAISAMFPRSPFFDGGIGVFIDRYGRWFW